MLVAKLSGLKFSQYSGPLAHARSCACVRACVSACVRVCVCVCVLSSKLTISVLHNTTLPIPAFYPQINSTQQAPVCCYSGAADFFSFFFFLFFGGRVVAMTVCEMAYKKIQKKLRTLSCKPTVTSFFKLSVFHFLSPNP